MRQRSGATAAHTSAPCQVGTRSTLPAKQPCTLVTSSEPWEVWPALACTAAPWLLPCTPCTRARPSLAAGRLIQAVRKAGVRDPLLLLDEVDKMGRDARGDPAAALLEVGRAGCRLDCKGEWQATAAGRAKLRPRFGCMSGDDPRKSRAKFECYWYLCVMIHVHKSWHWLCGAHLMLARLFGWRAGCASERLP